MDDARAVQSVRHICNPLGAIARRGCHGRQHMITVTEFQDLLLLLVSIGTTVCRRRAGCADPGQLLWATTLGNKLGLFAMGNDL